LTDKPLHEMTPEERAEERVRCRVRQATESGADLAEAAFFAALRDADMAAARAEAFREAAEMAHQWRFGGRKGLIFELKRKAAEAEES